MNLLLPSTLPNSKLQLPRGQERPDRHWGLYDNIHGSQMHTLCRGEEGVGRCGASTPVMLEVRGQRPISTDCMWYERGRGSPRGAGAVKIHAVKIKIMITDWINDGKRVSSEPNTATKRRHGQGFCELGLKRPRRKINFSRLSSRAHGLLKKGRWVSATCQTRLEK